MEIDFSKSAHGLIPAIIQDSETKNVLMLGYMNDEAFQKTMETGKVTFFSRSKQRLWTKGEESGHFLNLVDIKNDCDGDTLLIQAHPVGPTCHTGADTCWQTPNEMNYGFISNLETTIQSNAGNPVLDCAHAIPLSDFRYLIALWCYPMCKIAYWMALWCCREWCGESSTAQKVCGDALELLQRSSRDSPYLEFLIAGLARFGQGDGNEPLPATRGPSRGL